MNALNHRVPRGKLLRSFPALIVAFAVFLHPMTFRGFATEDSTGEIPASIRVVMDDNYPPYIFRDEQGRLKGILIDQWQLWERKTGIPAQVTGMDWADAQRRMQAGEFDVIDTIFRNEKRDRIYDFTKPYARIDVPLYFHQDISGIRGADDLKGFVVAAKSGDNVIDVLKKNGVYSIIEYPSYEKIIEAARDGKIKVFTIDKPAALYFMNKHRIQDKFRESLPLYTGEFHRAVLKGNAPLLATVENGFAAISADEYKAIDKRWMETPLSAAPLFRYVWHLLAAGVAFIVFLLIWRKGSTFKVLLPASTKPVELFNTTGQNTEWKGTGTVLLVDDEETVRAIGSEMLRILGFTVLTAPDGSEALRIFKTRPDIVFIILDLTMPHLDGEQFFRELRRINPSIKVLMSSGFNEQEVTQKFVGKGLAGFIQKPYKLSELKESIRKIGC